MFVPCPVVIDFRFKVCMYILISQSFVADFQFIVRISVIRINRFSVGTFLNGLIHKAFLGCFPISRVIIIGNSKFSAQSASQYRQVLYQPQVCLQHSLIQFIIAYVRQIGYRVCFQHIITTPESILSLHRECGRWSIEYLFEQSSLRCGRAFRFTQHTEHIQFQFRCICDIYIQIHAKIEKILFHLGIIAVSVVCILGIQQSHIILIVQDTEIAQPLTSPAESNIQLMTGRMITQRFLLPINIRIKIAITSGQKRSFVHIRLQAIISQCFIPGFCIRISVGKFRLVYGQT
ncbi:hypothetical protein IMSAGC001_04009 [Bacteroides acidifaciens]|uniref:Uncharacterized protein n=1 Tax=Bacteroides acidifaciens TaxID=85831 RepID=A0A7J0A8T1_9BACE|nr:hypothetical protein IMSAGC001_04009 [Bacteroides acidifaciens]